MRLSGWGRHPVLDCRLVTCRSVADLSSRLPPAGVLIPRGNGRSYGDAALNAELTLSTLRLDRFRRFDPTTGALTCESGVLLSEILETFVPRGWFPRVMPGTKFVTVGGMIAADVHGKNHHEVGTFGACLEQLELASFDGSIERCDRENDPELFRATLGGMGLTGVIASATIRLVPVETAFLREETVPSADLDETMARLRESDRWPYTVAWIDCLATGARCGRALVSRARHLSRSDLPAELSRAALAVHRGGGVRIPVDAPSGLLNRGSVKLFNATYYALGAARAGERIVHYDPFFFPLDGLLDWNRLYGRRGFVQFQCVLPTVHCARGLRELLERISSSGRGSFLAVLKFMGPQAEGWLSFPMEGYTLALDFPLRRGTLELLLELDMITSRYGGRVYLAKDARTSRERLREGYDKLEQFTQLRRDRGADRSFASAMSRRLGL